MKKPYTFNEVDTDTINEFEDVINVISTDDEPFDENEWLEAKMEQFVKQQKKSFAWKDYNKSK